MTAMLQQLLLHLLGAAFLALCLWLAHRRWLRPYGDTLTRQARGCLWLVIVTLWGGFVGAPFWFADVAGAFSWDLPPLAGRMLAAAGWAFAVAALFVLARPSRPRVQLFLVLLAVYLAPLVVIIVIAHRDRFDVAAPITYDFFVIAIGLAVAALWFLARQPTIVAPTPEDDLPPSMPVIAWLSACALITGGWGIVLFATDRGPWPTVWAWPGDLLTSRLIAVMLLAIAAGAATSLSQADRAGMALAVICAYGVGLTIASLWGFVVGTPSRPIYALVFGLLALGSASFLRLNKDNQVGAEIATVAQHRQR